MRGQRFQRGNHRIQFDPADCNLFRREVDGFGLGDMILGDSRQPMPPPSIPDLAAGDRVQPAGDRRPPIERGGAIPHLDRTRLELATAHATARAHQRTGNAVQAHIAIQAAVKWIWTHLLESWGERDASLGRLGTRFARLAAAHGHGDLATALDDLCDLDAASVAWRMAAAPDWVQERHDRSWRSRRHIGEPSTQEDDARDTLRVCALYELRRWPAGPFPGWLAVPTQATARDAKVARLSHLISQWFPEALDEGRSIPR
jgi:hypothetical protein